MPHAPVVGQLVTDMSQISPAHRPTSRPGRRIPTREKLAARGSSGARVHTRWCATCNTPLDPGEATTYCKACVAYRDKWKKYQKRLGKHGVVPIHREINDEIVEAAEQLEGTVRYLAAARVRGGPDPEQVDILWRKMYEHTLVLTTLIGENLYNPAD